MTPLCSFLSINHLSIVLAVISSGWAGICWSSPPNYTPLLSKQLNQSKEALLLCSSLWIMTHFYLAHRTVWTKDPLVLSQIKENKGKWIVNNWGGERKTINMPEGVTEQCAVSPQSQHIHCCQVGLLGSLLLSTVPRRRGESKVICPLVWISHHLPHWERPQAHPQAFVLDTNAKHMSATKTQSSFIREQQKNEIRLYSAEEMSNKMKKRPLLQ